MRKEIPYIHLLRSIACLMVVFLHSLPTSSFELHRIDSLFKTSVVLATSPCVPIFFMITGILILPTSCNYDIKSFYKKRILRVLYPLLFWGIIYSILPFVLGIQEFTSSVVELMLVPFVSPKEIGGILWYLYILIGIYLVIPFISSKLYVNRMYQAFYLILWLLSSLVYLAQMYEPRVLGINQWEHNVHSLSYFWGYFGFCILGLYISNNTYKLGGVKL